MAEDPRCPRCNGKVSATATWCMHCRADFEDTGKSRRVADRPTAAESDLSRFVRSFDRNEGTREVLALVVSLATLFPIVGLGTPHGGIPLALLAVIALGLYLRRCTDAKRILVHGAYGTAGLIVLLRLVSATLSVVPGDPLAVVLDEFALLIVGALIAAGWSIHQHVPEREPKP